MSKYARLSRAELTKRLAVLEAGVLTMRKALRADLARAALHDSEERVRAILQTAVEGIITIDERGIIESINPAAEKIFGYRAREIVGRNVNTLMPSPYRQEHDGYLANYRRTGKAKIIGIGREVVGRRKDGSVFPMDLSVGEMRLAGGRMFTGIVRDITERKRLEKQILEISDQERRRIGQDLHDDLGQRLAGIELMSEVLEQRLSAKSDSEASRAGEIATHVRAAISQSRSLARGLSPVVVESEGLMSALAELAAQTRKVFQVACVFHCAKPVPISDHTMAGHLYRIAQEAVSNAVKHGRAREINIHLRTGGEGTVLTVEDDGRGLPARLPKKKGMGLQIMRYRAGIIGGTLAVEPGSSGGTRVSCSIQTKKSPRTAKK